MNHSKEKLFLDYAKAEFDGYLASILYSIRDTNEEYKKLKAEQKKIIDKDEIVAKVLFEKDIQVLDEDQLQLMLEILDLEESIRMIEEKELFYYGGKEFYNYLKKLKIL